jgi:hypothetical protein
MTCIFILYDIAARIQIPANFHEIFEDILKSKICEADKENNMHIAKGTYNPCKLPKSGLNMQNKP